MAVPKTAALPLGYTPEKCRLLNLQPRGNSLAVRILSFKLRGVGSIPSSPAVKIEDMSASGLEPETGGLKGQCSTN